MKPDALSAYRAKRSPEQTPEPVGAIAPGAGRMFVVHKHAARQLHWDLRLELGGVLRSWAVPRGPSYDQKDKRLAVHVEDHPVEYVDFEGVIPEGNYGAGGMIVWDRGEWSPVGDPGDGLAKGKLLFDLKGFKLHGRWTLVKIKKSQKDWLLIKERDRWLRTEGGDDLPQESVLSGLTVEELKAGETPATLIAAELERLGAPRRPVKTAGLEPMLCEPKDLAFTREGWVFELKLDGYRLLVVKDGEHVLLQSRNGNDFTATFPEIARTVAALPVERVIIDGELVVLDPEGKPDFHLLQQRGRVSRTLDIRRGMIETPATLYAFDLLAFRDFDLRGLPLLQRKGLLQRMLPRLGAIRYLDHFETQGEALLAQVASHGLEGIIGKKADAPYRSGRSPAWVKIKAARTGDFAVVGFTPPKGSRAGLGALHLADLVDGELRYAGRAGSGFSDRQLTKLVADLRKAERKTPPCGGPWTADAPEADQDADWTKAVPDLKGSTWVTPELVAEVKYTEWTPDGVLRHPTFVRFRDDKGVQDCVRQGARPRPPRAAPASVATPARGPLQLSNLDKIYWPEDGYTKGDLLEYYRGVSPWLLPYLKDRPLVLTRFPDGIHGKSFYQKDAPEFSPEWIRTVSIWSEDTQRDIRYFLIDDVDGLLYVANLGSIPLHLWASRADQLERPDWCVIDLDPKEAPFEDVVTVAKVLHALCDEVGLPNFVKTTGKTGLHIMLPLGRQFSYEQSRTLGELLARLVIRELPRITTITRQVQRRGPKVYLDYLQNRHGQLIVAPFSVRPLPGAPVAMPLHWEEVNETLDPRGHTIRTAVERLRRFGEDPVAPVLTLVPDLLQVLERLGERQSQGKKKPPADR
jgi:bifunctional non-homologous end joining protein LigD